jgi:hypothetical protein
MSDMPTPGNEPVTPSPRQRVRRPRQWLWFFFFLATVPVALLGIEIWFNVQQQLTPEKLAEARARWEQNGPRDYVMEYEIKREYNPEPGTRAPDKYTVRVRDGKVELVTGADGRPPKPGEFEYGTMDDLFDRVARQLEADRAAGGKRPFVTATFDRRDRHIAHYVHSVSATRERLEVTVNLRPAGDS